MKASFFSAFILVIISCKKSPDIASYPDSNYITVKYDTTVIDSFSPGATPNNMKPKVLIIKDSLAEKKKDLENKIKTLENKKETDREKEKKKSEEKPQEQPKPISSPTD